MWSEHTHKCKNIWTCAHTQATKGTEGRQNGFNKDALLERLLVNVREMYL